MIMKIGVVGSGAIGLYVGARLQQAGHEVRFLLRRDYEAIRDSGLRVHSVRGDFHLELVQGFRRPEEIGPVDLVLVALKTFDSHFLPDLVRPLLSQQTAILTLQNGLGNEELLADAFGPGRVLGGVAIIGANRGEPGVVHHLALGSIRIGEFAAGRSPRCERLAADFSAAGIPCEAVADLRAIRWEKLIWNIPFNGLCTLLNATPGALLAHPPTRALVIELMTEVISGANAQGLAELIPVAEMVAAQLAKTEKHTADYRPSMMVDQIEGRALELESIFRIPLQHAARRGVAMVRVGMLLALLDQGEQGERGGQKPDRPEHR
jgi:2-dehydropantoate 2-reductase